MIQVTQIKVPLEAVITAVEQQDLRRGILSREEKNLVLQKATKILKIAPKNVTFFEVSRRSIDARKKQEILFSYTILLSCKEEKRLLSKKNVKQITPVEKAPHKKRRPKPSLPPVVVGMGPAGMFAALELAEKGVCPIVLERGSAVEERRKKVTSFWQGGSLDPECNVQFGEGGAGTFSDGKLNTMVKDPTGRNRQVLETFVRHGAPEEILYLQKPHIGTDRLEAVVRSIRERIIALGGKVCFNTRFDGILQKEDAIQGIICTGPEGQYSLACDTVILAVGHSARDTFQTLLSQGIHMQPKAFAVGVRMEHPQEMIGKDQYGEYWWHLPVASYKLTHTTQQGKGVYSFCMCPGGKVVNASSEEGYLVVNGMSEYARDGENANSAIVVTVSAEDFGTQGILSGMEFQRKLEKAAYQQGKGNIPLQLLQDFMENKPSKNLGAVQPSLCGGYHLTNVRQILPKEIGDAIAESIPAFDKRLPGFGRKDALISGVETRTSSPIRILRDQTFQSNIKGLYPCGEGAGYAGGITSAAMDGLKIAEELLYEKEREA